MKGTWNVGQEWKPALLMVVVQVAFAAVNVFYKLAIIDGMSMRVATAYRLSFATAFTVPLALIFDRKKRPKMTWRVLSWAFLSGLFGGSLFQNLFYEALALTSATFMLAMFNLYPAITFIIAKCYSFEKLNLGEAAGKAKVLGTVFGIGGAMLLTFFKGVEIHIWPFHINLLHPHQRQNGHAAPPHAQSGSKVWGFPCAIASLFSYSFWFVIQAKLIEEYPSHHSSTALMSAMGAIQAIVFALSVDRDWSQWKLGWNIRFLAVAYSAIVASGTMTVVIAWCIRVRGPLFASIFHPLQLLLVAVVASLMLDENLYLGSVLGAVLIVCGLYMVLWGKSKEMTKMTQLVLEPLEITKESEAIEVVAMSTPSAVDHDERDHKNRSQTIITRTTGNGSPDMFFMNNVI